jgi:hypothetical protein
MNRYQQLDLLYLANLDNYDILSNRELVWLLSSNVEEERIIATLLLRDRISRSFANIFNYEKS